MPDPNLWKAGKACIKAHGDDASAEPRRLAQFKLTACDVEEEWCCLKCSRR